MALFKNYPMLSCVRSILRFAPVLVVATAAFPREGMAEDVRFQVSDAAGATVPCRIHLTNDKGEPQKAAGQPFWHDHFVCSGRVALEMPAGIYAYQIERGPEWNRAGGTVEVADGQSETVDVTLNRIANLGDEGWICGDLHVHRPVEEIERLMLAEDLDFAPVISWWNKPAKDTTAVPQTEFRFDTHRIYSIMAGEDEREGGALLYFGLDRPLDLSVRSREFPSPMHFVDEARARNRQVWIDVEKPFWWDVPTWLATGQMNSIGIANNHMCRGSMYPNEAWGKPRDTGQLPDPLGNGYWSQEIYYHLLDSGLRLPPSAGSASGVLPNPVGYNRVYVHLPKAAADTDSPQFTQDSWFAGLARGECFVTNGPLLRVRANGKLPGEVITLSLDAPQPIELSIQLTSNDPVAAVEVISNGKVLTTIPCSDQIDQQLSAEVILDQPGWFLVRAITDVPHTFRFASTAPWYVASADVTHRVSRRSAQFFLDWVNERIERIEAGVTNADQRQAVMSWHLQARKFWNDKVATATSD